jgi:putative oxidoreductase
MVVPMNPRIANHARKILRWVLGALMVWAALGQIANPQEFLAAIYGYELPLPEMLLRVTAVALPWLELLCGLALLAGVWNEAALGILIILMTIFVIATGQAWIRGLDISCGCFGTALEETSFLGTVRFAFFRNLAILGLVVYLWIAAGKDSAPDTAEEEK